MPELTFGVHRVGVAPTDLGLAQILIGLKVGEDRLRGALGDTYSRGDVTDASVRIAVYVDQDVTVIRQKRPLPPRLRHR